MKQTRHVSTINKKIIYNEFRMTNRHMSDNGSDCPVSNKNFMKDLVKLSSVKIGILVYK